MQFAEWSLPEKKTKNTCWWSKIKLTINTYFSKGHYNFDAILEVSLGSVKALLKATVQDPSFKNRSVPLIPREAHTHESPQPQYREKFHTGESSKKTNILFVQSP